MWLNSVISTHISIFIYCWMQIKFYENKLVSVNLFNFYAFFVECKWKCWKCAIFYHLFKFYFSITFNFITHTIYGTKIKGNSAICIHICIFILAEFIVNVVLPQHAILSNPFLFLCLVYWMRLQVRQISKCAWKYVKLFFIYMPSVLNVTESETNVLFLLSINFLTPKYKYAWKYVKMSFSFLYILN